MILGTMNVWAVVGAAAAAFAAGALWHGPLFGKQWIKMMGWTAKDMKKMQLTPLQAMGMAAVVQLIVAGVLSKLFALTGVASVGNALYVVFLLWLGVSAPLLFGSFLWENKSLKLWAFNAAYRLVELAVMAAVLGRWG